MDEVRQWLSPATNWDKSHSERILEKLREFDDLALS
jgi:hypothetical protein